MARTLVATMRQANRLMRPRKMSRSTRSFQKVMRDFKVKSALSAINPKATKSHKAITPKARFTGAALRQSRAVMARSVGYEASPRISKGTQ